MGFINIYESWTMVSRQETTFWWREDILEYDVLIDRDGVNIMQWEIFSRLGCSMEYWWNDRSRRSIFKDPKMILNFDLF